MKNIISFFKREAVMVISFVLAVCTMFFVPPSTEYVGYIDFRTLALLFSLMTIMAGLSSLGFFKLLAEKLLSRAKSVRSVILALVLLCFFSSMIITNDISLITFVPFTIVTLKLAGEEKHLILTVTLETVAANLGSMLTPIGNPQNLYLYSAYKMNISDFFVTIFPYALFSFIILFCFSMFFGKKSITAVKECSVSHIDKKLLILYSALFIVALLSVFRLINCVDLLGTVIAAVLICDPRVLLKVDYSLLLTFVFLFIFIGNLGNIPEISKLLSDIVGGNEVITGVIASQVFSNVPTAILLSGFTDNAFALMVGVNLGGLGTLIASMASLISFKFIQREGVSAARYIGVFTAVNIFFLASNLLLWFFIE